MTQGEVGDVIGTQLISSVLRWCRVPGHSQALRSQILFAHVVFSAQLKSSYYDVLVACCGQQLWLEEVAEQRGKLVVWDIAGEAQLSAKTRT